MAANKGGWTGKTKKSIKSEPKNEKNTVNTVVKNEISDAKNESGTIINAKQEIGLKKTDLQGKKEKSKVIGSVGGTEVKQAQGRIRFEAQMQPFPMFMLPEDIRKWLISNGLTSDVYTKDKEWLEKHNVDMEMVEKLKKFLTERL